MNEEKKNFDLEERLVDYAVIVVRISDSLNKTEAAKIVNSHLLRSATSTALHYGEVKDAESRVDFIHKVKVVLKEMREVMIALKIILKVPLSKNLELVTKGKEECNELISIFVKSIETARKNNNNKK